jgi:molecular chaperone DnaK
MQRIVLGIDFGMSNSRIAYIDKYHKPVVIHNQEHGQFTPSVIHFRDKDGFVVGDEAVNMLVVDPQNTVAFIKRNMGRPDFRLSIHNREYTPQEIAAGILKKLKTDAEIYFRNQGQEVEVKDAVITVPAYFGMEQKGATRDAGELARLNVLMIINEPTAAALAFGINTLGKDQTVFVFDLGGRTFDVTILEIKGNEINMMASDGDPELGGKDWDDLLTSHCSCLFKEKYGDDPQDDLASYQDLSDRVVKAKILLSIKPKALIRFSHAGNSENVEITREEFIELSKGLLAQCKSFSERVLKKAYRTWNDIDTVLLVGGSTNMPMIRNMIKEISGKEPSTVVNPDQCVAIGAAYQGHNIATDLEFPLPFFTKTKYQGHNITLPEGCKCCEEYFKEREKEHNKITKVLEEKDVDTINGTGFHTTSRHDDSVKMDKKILPYNYRSISYR